MSLCHNVLLMDWEISPTGTAVTTLMEDLFMNALQALA